MTAADPALRPALAGWTNLVALTRWLGRRRHELKDVVNLAFHEFLERRKYLPSER
jgi:hypothetical protein